MYVNISKRPWEIRPRIDRLRIVVASQYFAWKLRTFIRVFTKIAIFASVKSFIHLSKIFLFYITFFSKIKYIYSNDNKTLYMEIHFKILILIVTNAYFIYYRKIHSILISLNKSKSNLRTNLPEQILQKKRKKRYILTKRKKDRQRIIKVRKYHGSQYSRARATLDFWKMNTLVLRIQE